MKRLALLFGTFLINIIYALPSPYNELKEILPFDPHGWYANYSQIATLIRQNKIETVIEIGSWLGASTRHIASLIPSNGKVYAIDHWLGSPEHQPGNSAHYRALPYLYEQFLSNVIHAGLTDKIIPVRMSSLEAVKILNVYPDLIYLDARHETELVYLDLNAWFPIVKGHGILCGDDWLWPSVAEAVQRFAQENKLGLEVSGNFWRLIE